MEHETLEVGSSERNILEEGGGGLLSKGMEEGNRDGKDSKEVGIDVFHK